MIIYGWQQLENIKENVLELKVSNRSMTRRIQLGNIKTYLDDGTRINPSVKTQILNSPARKIERLFNCMPSDLRDIAGTPTEFFKGKLDEWLRDRGVSRILSSGRLTSCLTPIFNL